MTDLEDRLRRDLKIDSERIGPESVRPLRVPPPRRRTATVRWLAPVAAMAAVISVIAGVSLAGRSAGPTHPPSQSMAPAPGTMPPYYVTIQETFTRVSTAIVRDSETGAALVSVRLPLLYPAGLREITAAADDRTFVITDGDGLFLLRVAADGRSARLRKLAIKLPDLESVTLSPDGRTLAIESQSCTGAGVCRDNAIQLVSLATGATRTWSTHALALQNIWISWDGNGQVFFSWLSAHTAPPPQQSGFRLLNVAAAGGDLLAARLLPLPAPPLANGYYYEQPTVVTPDGSGAITSTSQEIPGPDGSGTLIAKVVEYSMRTGQLIRVLYVTSEHFSKQSDLNMVPNQGCSVLSLGPTGVHALIECSIPQAGQADPHPRSGQETRPQVVNPIFGRLDNGRFTPLPGMPGGVGGDAAW